MLHPFIVRICLSIKHEHFVQKIPAIKRRISGNITTKRLQCTVLWTYNCIDIFDATIRLPH